MLRKTVVLGGILALALGGIQVVGAQPLTESQVQRYLDTVPQAQALSEKHNDGKRRKIDPARPLSSSLAQLKGQGGAYADLAALAGDHGFSGPEEWADVGDRVMNAYLVLNTSLSEDEIEQGYQQGVANIENNADLSSQQKQAILTGMQRAHKRNQDRRLAARQDLPAVRPYHEDLRKVYE